MQLFLKVIINCNETLQNKGMRIKSDEVWGFCLFVFWWVILEVLSRLWAKFCVWCKIVSTLHLSLVTVQFSTTIYCRNHLLPTVYSWLFHLTFTDRTHMFGPLLCSMDLSGSCNAYTVSKRHLCNKVWSQEMRISNLKKHRSASSLSGNQHSCQKLAVPGHFLKRVI